MKTKRTRHTQARGGLSRERILAMATRLFAEQGFAAVSMREIAMACDVSIPSIYHFFGDKESLYQSCYKATFEGAAHTLHDAVSGAATAELRIGQFTRQFCAILMENQDFCRLLQREFLREEHRHISELTTHHFQQEFRLLTDSIAEKYGAAQARERAFSIYALSLGLVQLRRIGELAGMDKAIAKSPASLAKYVLGIVFPATLKPRARPKR